MVSLVKNLQREALDENHSIASLLRKALVVSRKLGINNFENWIQSELKGWSWPNDQFPNYRNVKGETKVYNPYIEWQKLNFSDHTVEKVLLVQNSFCKFVGES